MGRSLSTTWGQEAFQIPLKNKTNFVHINPENSLNRGKQPLHNKTNDTLKPRLKRILKENALCPNSFVDRDMKILNVIRM